MENYSQGPQQEWQPQQGPPGAPQKPEKKSTDWIIWVAAGCGGLLVLGCILSVVGIGVLTLMGKKVSAVFSGINTGLGPNYNYYMEPQSDDDTSSLPADVSSEVQRLLPQGRQAYEAGNYEQALSLYTRALSLDPSCALAYYNRGFVYEALGEKEQAANDFEQARSLSSDPYWQYAASNKLQALVE